MKKDSPSKKFIIDLPFEHKRAVLTQSRTHTDGVCPFIVEFYDGSRKFMKGPYRERKKAEAHIICNEIKKRLDSDYIHPIECELREYGAQAFFLVCEELGKADLDETNETETKMDGKFEVLKYDSDDDFTPDPFAGIHGINERNQDVWVRIVVNYCFRWIFGIGDAAKRNLMLQRSTGKIYSVDEASIDSVDHESIWHRKSPGKEVISLVQKFVNDKESLKLVVEEVSRWKRNLNGICFELRLKSGNIEKRAEDFLRNPEKVLVTVK